LTVYIIGHADRDQPDSLILARRGVLYRQWCFWSWHVIFAVGQDDRDFDCVWTSSAAWCKDLGPGQIESVIEIGAFFQVTHSQDSPSKLVPVPVSRQTPFDRRFVTEQHEGDLYVVGSDCECASDISDEMQRGIPVAGAFVVYAARGIDNEIEVK